MSGDRVVDYPIFAGAGDMRGRWRSSTGRFGANCTMRPAPSPRSKNSGFDGTNTSLTKSATSFRSSTATSHLASGGNSRVSSSTACQPRTGGAFLPMCRRHNASPSSCSAAAVARPTGPSCTAHPSQPDRWASGCGSAGTNGIAIRRETARTPRTPRGSRRRRSIRRTVAARRRRSTAGWCSACRARGRSRTAPRSRRSR